MFIARVNGLHDHATPPYQVGQYRFCYGTCRLLPGETLHAPAGVIWRLSPWYAQFNFVSIVLDPVRNGPPGSTSRCPHTHGLGHWVWKMPIHLLWRCQVDGRIATGER